MKGSIPDMVSDAVSRSDLESLAGDLRGSIAIRRDLLIDLGNAGSDGVSKGNHGRRLAEEERLLRQVERRLGEMLIVATKKGRVPERGDRLLREVLSSGSEDAAYELLDELFAGYPVKTVSRLLQSDTESVVRAGVWLASELGASVEPLVDDLFSLLGHPSSYVRYLAISGILNAGGGASDEAVAAAASTVADKDSSVQLMAMKFLAKADVDKLSTCVKCIHESAIAVRVEWLVDCMRSVELDSVRRQLISAGPIDRMVAAAAAARLAPHDASLLEVAANSTDAQVREFATRELRYRAL